MRKEHIANHAEDITGEACAWIAQLETGDLTPKDVEAFREWMQRSPRHRQEARRMARLSAELNCLNDLEPALLEAAEHYRPVTRRRAGRGRGSKFSVSATFGGLAAVAATLVVAVMAVFQLLQPQYPAALETPIGAHSKHVLEDGSIVKLNTNSRVEIAYSREQRDIVLRRGEAFFEVAHDKQRPFVVHVNDRAIRALGTAFAVRLNSEDLQVTVTEGVVEFSESRPEGNEDQAPVHQAGGSTLKSGNTGQRNAVAAASSPELRAEVHAGQRLILAGRSRIPKVSPVAQEMIRRNLMWREGLFDFSNTPLEEVVREFKRYTPRNIEIVDPALSQREFSGIFSTGDIDLLLGVLQRAYGIEVTYADDGTVRLGRARQG